MAALCSAKNHRNPSNTQPTSTVDHQRKLVVTIPADLPLTEAERSVLSKGLTFVPLKKAIDEFQTKADCENLYRRIRLWTHFHNDGESESQPIPDSIDPFAKFNPKESTCTPPEGEFSAVDHYIDDRCRRAINNVDFKAKTIFSNLSISETTALLQLSKRSDILIKPADKGGAVVWSRPLSIAAGKRQLSGGRFYERLDNDPTINVNHRPLNSTVTDVIDSVEFPGKLAVLVKLHSRHKNLIHD